MLADAQAAGYAEADPSGDVEGDDAVNKLVILARLAFGCLARSGLDRTAPADASRATAEPGISGVTADGGQGRGCGRADAQARSPGRSRTADGSIAASVLPTAVRGRQPARADRRRREPDRGRRRADRAGSPSAGRAPAVRRRAARSSATSSRSPDPGPGAPGPAWPGRRSGGGVASGARPLGRTVAPPRRFFASTLPDQLVRDQVEIEAAKGGGFVTAAQPLDELRAGLAAAGVEATLYPIDGVSAATMPARPSLVDRYRRFLPVGAATPALTLGEGFTPLVHARRLGAELGLSNLYLKVEGANPTGSFKDRGMVVAVSRALEAGARSIVCASTGNTSASAAAYGAAAGLEVVVVLPKGQIAIGKLLQALIAGARVVAVDGNFDAALRIVRELAAPGRPPDHPRQLGQSGSAGRPEDGGVRGLRRPRAGARTSWRSRSATPATSAPTGPASATTARRV